MRNLKATKQNSASPQRVSSSSRRRRLLRRAAIAAAFMSTALVGSCTCYVDSSYDCYYYYGYSTTYCDYNYMDPYAGSAGYYPVYYSTLDPSLTPHPDPMIAPKISDATVNLTNYIYIEHLDEIAEGDVPRGTSTLDDSHPCGDETETSRVLCDDDGATARDEDYIVVAATAEQELEADHKDDFLLLTFSFQRDADASNDYVPPAELANDYAGGADKWYVAVRDPADGWSLQVFESDGASIANVDSDARVVVEVDTAALLVPAAEFDVTTPASRISFFRHQGDEGTGPDANWSGFVYPPLGEPLIQP